MTVRATVVALSGGVDTVTAGPVRQRDGQALPVVSLQRQGTSETFQGSIMAPANTRNDGQSETYTVSVVAGNTAGQTQRTAGTFDVPPPPTAPEPPRLSEVAK